MTADRAQQTSGEGADRRGSASPTAVPTTEPDPVTDPIPDDDLARLVDLALDQADAEGPLLDALDAAVDAHGRDAVIDHLRTLTDHRAAA